MRISIGNEQFFGFEDSMCRPILNDISVTFTILMRYLVLINRAFFFYILLTIKLSEIIAMPALPFPASIWTKIPCLASIEFPQKCISKFVTLVLPQDEIARIRKRKRGRNMLNRSGNTTDNLCFRYRFRDVFSRFRCCVYNGTGPLFVHVKHNGNMELHVSATFQKYGNM